MEYDKHYLHNMYNATSTDDPPGSDELETYESWLERQLISRLAKVDKLQAFKDYVHKRLDEAGVEKEPNGEHSKAGCRVGDRLDIVLNGKTIDISDLIGSYSVDESKEVVKEIDSRIRHAQGNNWISVREKNPTHAQTIVVLTDLGGVYKASFNQEPKLRFVGWEEWDSDCVTHWMPFVDPKNNK